MSQNHPDDPLDLPGTIPRTNLQGDSEPIHTVNSHNGPSHVLTPLPSHVSHTHDAPIEHISSLVEVPDEVYDRLPHSRKLIIVALLSYCGLLAPISSTTVLSAVPEVAATYNTSGTIINLSNALYMLFMGFSPCFWGPLSQVYGRRIVSTPRFCYENLEYAIYKLMAVSTSAALPDTHNN
jgi:hypothetical protein